MYGGARPGFQGLAVDDCLECIHGIGPKTCLVRRDYNYEARRCI